MSYVTGNTINIEGEGVGSHRKALAEKINVSDKRFQNGKPIKAFRISGSWKNWRKR